MSEIAVKQAAVAADKSTVFKITLALSVTALGVGFAAVFGSR